MLVRMSTTTDETTYVDAIPAWTMADRMRKARAMAKISRPDMANALEVDESTITRWEHHHSTTAPGSVQALAWASLCRVDPLWLLTGEGSTSTIWYRAFAWSRRVLGLRSEGIRWAS